MGKGTGMGSKIPFVRRALYEAASALMTRFKRTDKLKTWGQALAKRGSHRKATVAVARKMAVIMHAMWTDGSFYQGGSGGDEATVAARRKEKEIRLLGAHRRAWKRPLNPA